MWKDFKYDLKRLYKSCPPEKWETRRDKRLTRITRVSLLNIALQRRYMCLFLFRIFSFIGNYKLYVTYIVMVLIEILYWE